jgi:hypothetical protein
VAFGGLMFAQVEYARDHDDQEDHAPDYDAGDCAGGDAAHAVVEGEGGRKLVEGCEWFGFGF